MDLKESNTKQSKNITQWEQFKRLGVFQLKLALDALRDVLLSPLSIIATAVDISEGKHGNNSYFEKLLALGRHSEKKINLFNQHSDEPEQKFTVDTVVDQIESIVKKEYQEGELSSTAKKALEKSIQALKKVNTPPK